MIRVKWSDLVKGQKMKVVCEPLSKTRIYANDRFILFPAYIEFTNYVRHIELSIPWMKFKRSLLSLPLSTQNMFKYNKVKFYLTKLDKGKCKIEQVRVHG